MLYRTGGKLCFATIKDGTGDIQVMISRDRSGEEAPGRMEVPMSILAIRWA